MYKGASDNAVSRSHRAATQGRANEAGIDDVYRKISDADQARAGLMEYIKLNELALAEFNQKEAEAKAMLAVKGRHMQQGAWNDLQRAKIDAKRKITEAQIMLSQLKLKHVKLNSERERFERTSFDAKFREAAKRLLVPEIYERLIVATLHEMSGG